MRLRTLIITDIDTVNTEGKKCRVSEGVYSSNACVNSWFTNESGEKTSKDELLLKSKNDKTRDTRRLAFQIPDGDNQACGRSLEDAFMLANAIKFEIQGTTPQVMEADAWAKAANLDKTEFAMKHAILDTNWEVPRYILEGLEWLAASPDIPDAGDPESELAEIGDQEDTDA